MPKPNKKIFVIDTNVILHDATCVRNFEDNDIVIPISVLEELDQFKRGNEQLHYNARDFLRNLDELSVNSEESELKKLDGKIRVVVNHNWHPDVEATFNEDCPDNRIINCAYKLHHENSEQDVILVSKDTNMRLKARSLGINAEDYFTDAVENVSKIYTGNRLVEDVSSEQIDLIYKSHGVDIEDLDAVIDPQANENFILRNGQKSILAAFDPFDEKIVQINIELESDNLTFAIKDVFLKAACHLIRGGTLEMLGTQIPDFQNKASSLKAVTTQNSIKGTIIHIDSYGNATTNINHEIFNRIGLERDFEILYGKETERITKIKKKYKDVTEGERVALFSTDGFLEIAMNQGKANKLLGLYLYDIIRIEFKS